MSKALKNYFHLTGSDGLYDGVENQVKGEKGAPGQDGTNGIKGLTGPKGTKGHDGHVTTIVGSWTTASIATLPLNGTFPPDWDVPGSPASTFQVNVGESMIYMPANTADPYHGHMFAFIPGANVTGWVDIGKIGAVTGQTGAKGDGGDKGEKGVPGADGTNGSNGTAGFKGQKGAEGSKGATGSSGANGTSGQKGETGVQGQKGNEGAVGAAGSTGLKGTIGSKGQKGVTGLSGATGLGGSKGQKGEDAQSGGIATVVAAFDCTNHAPGDTITALASHNVSTITQVDADSFRIRFQRKMPNLNYATIVQGGTGNITVTNRTMWTILIQAPSLPDYLNLLVWNPDATNISSGGSGGGY